MSNWKGFSRSMRHMSRDGNIMQMCILIVLYIGVSVFIAGGDMRKFKRSNGEVVFGTIQSTSIYSESHGTGRRRHTTITQTANVEFTYNEETHTATVYKPFTKKVGDKIKLGITEDGRVYSLYMKFDLTFLIITAIYIVFLIVLWMKTANQKEAARNAQTLSTNSYDDVTDSYIVKFEDDIYKKEEVNEVPKLKFELKQPLNHEKDYGQDE